MDTIPQKKTKENLKNTLVKLMQKKPLCEITVQELAIESNIARSSFYYHYSSIMDIAEEIIQDIKFGINHINIDFFMDPLSDEWYHVPNPYIEKTLHFEYEHRNEMLVLLGKNGDPRMRDEIIKCIQHHFIAKRFYYSDNPARDVAIDSFFISGHIAHILHWLQNDEAPDFADMAVKVYTMMFPRD